SRGFLKRTSHGQGTFAPVTKKAEDRDKLLDKLRTEQTGARQSASKDPIKDPPSKEEPAQPAGQSKGENKASTAAASAVRRRKTVKQKGTDGRHKKRAVVYHEEEKYPWGYSDSHGQHHGRRGSSGSVDDYVRGSSSDEYKRRMHETHEKMRERKGEAEDIGYFYKIIAAVLALIIILLSTVIFFMASRETIFNEYDLTYTMNLETMRYELGILTENIDCSLHMK
ncbi:hypothetical protein GCK32_012277, partial [Trichostrongylus colubriformis]